VEGNILSGRNKSRNIPNNDPNSLVQKFREANRKRQQEVKRKEDGSDLKNAIFKSESLEAPKNLTSQQILRNLTPLELLEIKIIKL
jgi:hypothetical protein